MAEWLERCASIPKITSSNPSSGSELIFRFDLLLTARGGSTWAFIEFACLLCYLGNTLLSAPRAALGLGRRYTNPQIYLRLTSLLLKSHKTLSKSLGYTLSTICVVTLFPDTQTAGRTKHVFIVCAVSVPHGHYYAFTSPLCSETSVQV
jgi:hypothetical protein